MTYHYAPTGEPCVTSLVVLLDHVAPEYADLIQDALHAEGYAVLQQWKGDGYRAIHLILYTEV